MHSLISSVRSCKKCPLSCKVMPMIGEGSLNADIVFVDTSPGIGDYFAGGPFKGESGQLLIRALVEAGFKDLNKFTYRTNSVKCFNTDGNFKGNTAEEYLVCGDWLDDEIKLIKPKLIVSFGSGNTYRFSNHYKNKKIMDPIKAGKITEKHGNFEWSEDYQCYIYYLFAPSYVFKNQAKFPSFLDAVKNMKAFVDNDYKIVEEKSKKSFHYFYQKKGQSFEDYRTETKKFLNWLNQNLKETSLDLETTGYDFISDEICYVSIGWKDGAAAIRVVDTWFDELDEYITRPDISKIMANGKFDHKFLFNRGLRIGGFNFDTQIAGHLLDENDSSSLENLSMRYLGLSSYKNDFWETGVDIKSEDPEIIKRWCEYAAEDAYRTYHLGVLLKERLILEDLYESPFNRISMPLANVLPLMEYKGITYNEEYTEELNRILHKEAEEIKNEIKSYLFDKMYTSLRDVLRESLSCVNELILKTEELFEDEIFNSCMTVKQSPQTISILDNSKRMKDVLESAIDSNEESEINQAMAQCLSLNLDTERKVSKSGRVTNSKVGILVDLKKVCTSISKNLSYSDEMKDLSPENRWTPKDLESKTNRYKRERATYLKMQNLIGNFEKFAEKLSNFVNFDVNPNSSKQVGYFFYDVLGLPIIKRSKDTKQPSTDKEVIEELSKKYTFPKLIRDYREKRHDISNYTEGFNKFRHPMDGRMHAQYGQTFTDTGRLNCKEPALHGLKREFRIRNMIVPSHGNLFIEGDLSQAEVMFLAILANDENLLDVFRSGGDIHTQNACRIFNKEAKDISKEERSHTKRIVFGVIYGMAVQSLAESLGISVEGAQNLMDRFFLAYPKCKTYLDGIKRDVVEIGYTRNYYNRKRRFYVHDTMRRGEYNAILRQAGNAPIQSSATGDYMGLVHVKFQEYIDEFHPQLDVFQVHNHHDCALVEAPARKALEVAKHLQRIAENADPGLPIKMKFDCAVVRCYSGIPMDESDIEKYIEGLENNSLPLYHLCKHTKDERVCNQMFVPKNADNVLCPDHFKS